MERTRLNALLEEITLSGSSLVDPTTAARAGRILRAGRVLHGTALIAADGRMRLDVAIMDSSSRVVGSESVTGRLESMFDLEKDAVLRLASSLGYQLSEAERARILANGTRSITAFLAFSDGVMRQAEGDFSAAAASFSRAVRADPQFQQAREASRANDAAAGVNSGQEGGGAESGTPAARAATATVTAATVANGVHDVAATAGERLNGGSTSQQAASTPSTTAPPPTSGILSRMFTFGISLVFRFP